MEISFLNIEYIFNLIYTLLVQGELMFRGLTNIAQGSFYQDILRIWSIFSVFATITALALGSIITYSLFRIRQIRLAEAKVYGADSDGIIVGSAPKENEQWENILKLSMSENENNWRQAIINADIMLDKMLTSIGYEGDSVAEKLKQIEPSDFQTLQYAWEAHKVRNRVAHDGSDFLLTRRDTREVISWFKVVFEEFFFI